jgi:hypothetical protein
MKVQSRYMRSHVDSYNGHVLVHDEINKNAYTPESPISSESEPPREKLPITQVKTLPMRTHNNANQLCFRRTGGLAQQ